MLRTSSCVAAFLALVAIGSPASAIVVGPELTIPGSAVAPVRGPWGGWPASDGTISASRCGDAYLVVWGAADGIYAARVTASGDIVDAAPKQISPEGNSPSVASNGETCLVVWASTVPPSPILAQRLTFQLDPIDPQPLTVGQPLYYPYPMGVVTDSRVATDGTDYLVTYYRMEYETAGLGSAVVTHDGQVVGDAAFTGYITPVFDDRIQWSTTYGGAGYFLAYNNPTYYPCNWWYDSTTATATGPAGADPATYTFDDPASCTGFQPIAAAANDAGFLVAYNVWDAAPTPASVPSFVALKVARFAPPALSDAAPLVLEQGPLGSDGFPVVAAFDGKQYLVIWFTPADAPAQAYGAVLAATAGGTPSKEQLFAGSAAVPALVSAKRGVSLLLYAAPSSTDPATKDVKARLIITDDTPPTVTVPGAIAATATRRDGAVVTFTATATDDASGALQPTCMPASGSVFPPGTTHVQCMAVDEAGNMGVGSFDVTVTFSWSGILQPINADGSSIFKAGRTVPVKFQLTGASGAIADLAARLTVYRVTDAILGSVEEAATSTSAATTGDLFRFDATSGQYVFNLALAVGTWKVRVDMGDGVDRSVQLSLRK